MVISEGGVHVHARLLLLSERTSPPVCVVFQHHNKQQWRGGIQHQYNKEDDSDDDNELMHMELKCLGDAQCQCKRLFPYQSSTNLKGSCDIIKCVSLFSCQSITAYMQVAW